MLSHHRARARSLPQMYDFGAPCEAPVAVAYHPGQQQIGVGFESGAVRVFNVTTISMIAELKCVAQSGSTLHASCPVSVISIGDGVVSQWMWRCCVCVASTQWRESN